MAKSNVCLQLVNLSTAVVKIKPWLPSSNETVSLGDTAISLHTDTPTGQTPPGKTPPLWADTPLGRHHPWADTLTTQNSKCQVLAKFKFMGGGVLNYSNYQVLAKFSWGGVFLTTLELIFLAKWTKNSGSLTCSYIADSLSYTMCVETHAS